MRDEDFVTQLPYVFRERMGYAGPCFCDDVGGGLVAEARARSSAGSGPDTQLTNH